MKLKFNSLTPIGEMMGMKYKIRHITTFGGIEESEIELTRDKDGSFYTQLNHKLKPILGGTIEHVNVWWYWDKEPFHSMDMFVLDWGGGQKFNEIASKIYRNNAIMHQGATAEELPPIVGPAVLFEKRVWR